MSDEKLRRRREHDDDEAPEVEGHGDVADESGEIDPERRRRRREFEDKESEDLGRRKK